MRVHMMEIAQLLGKLATLFRSGAHYCVSCYRLHDGVLQQRHKEPKKTSLPKTLVPVLHAVDVTLM